MLATAKNLLHATIQGSKAPTDTNTPELSKYTTLVHFPDLRIGKTLIPAGVENKIVWGTSPLDACQWMMGHFTTAEWVELVR